MAKISQEPSQTLKRDHQTFQLGYQIGAIRELAEQVTAKIALPQDEVVSLFFQGDCLHGCSFEMQNTLSRHERTQGIALTISQERNKEFGLTPNGRPPTPESSSVSPKTINNSNVDRQLTSPPASTGSSNCPRPKPTKLSSREKRVQKILEKETWRSKSGVPPRQPSSSNLVPKPSFSPPKPDEVQAAMKTLAGNVPDKVRNIISVVLQQQALFDGAVMPFRPSYPALQRIGLLPDLDEHRSMASSSSGVSPNYLGDVSVPENQSADISKEENCSLWLLGLPAEVSYTTLLRSIRGAGKVFATHISPAFNGHRNAAAKVVFFDRKGAEIIFNMARDGSFRVLGRVVRAHWNRIKVATQPNSGHSRAIRITGPAQLMDFDFFEIYFKALFTFQLDQTFVVPSKIQGCVSHEWHFASFRCQSQHAKSVVERDLAPTFGVEWARDPCQYH